MRDWSTVRNLLCVRADNLGDVIMSSPALRALKESFGCKITLLCSQAASQVAVHLPEVSDVIAFDLPWVKLPAGTGSELSGIITTLSSRNFDAVVIFTVYSQSPLPAALLCWIAGIRSCLAYCRENPYHLISDWIPDPEPIREIKHQVRRDLDLVASIGAYPSSEDLRITLSSDAAKYGYKIASLHGFSLEDPFIILHPGVSEIRREYPESSWFDLAKLLASQVDMPVVVTGNTDEQQLTKDIASAAPVIKDLGGKLSLEAFTVLVSKASLIITVNTSTTHLAAAFKVGQIVLYAQTNPQHTPWMSPAFILELPVTGLLKSRNEIIMLVDRLIYQEPRKMPLPNQVATLALEILNGKTEFPRWEEWSFGRNSG